MWKVNITLDEECLKYLRSLVESGECKSVSHATRKIIKEYRKTHLKQWRNDGNITLFFRFLRVLIQLSRALIELPARVERKKLWQRSENVLRVWWQYNSPEECALCFRSNTVGRFKKCRQIRGLPESIASVVWFQNNGSWSSYHSISRRCFDVDIKMGRIQTWVFVANIILLHFQFTDWLGCICHSENNGLGVYVSLNPWRHQRW